MSSGERPIGAAKGKQSDTEALCQPPPPRNAQGKLLRLVHAPPPPHPYGLHTLKLGTRARNMRWPDA